MPRTRSYEIVSQHKLKIKARPACSLFTEFQIIKYDDEDCW